MSEDNKNTNQQETSKKESVVVKEKPSRVRIAQPQDVMDLTQENFKPTKIIDPDARFKDLQEVTDYLSDEDKETLVKAYEFAKKCHSGQKRKSGEMFVVHPVEVGITLADLHMDIDTLCAGLLHDTIEDTEATYTKVKDTFNREVADLVEGVTKITQIEVGSISESQALTLRKMFVAMSNDLRVIVIKLSDRLHNMRTLYAIPEDRQIYKANETLEIFAPIAHRLGIDSIKWELEDLSFFYLEPNKYRQIARMVVESRDERKVYVNKVIDILQKELESSSISGRIMGRPKHLYSIYCKMKNNGKAFSEIYDLIAVRIIVNTVKECYAALGAVHSL